MVFFSDAVYAIILTILVLDIRTPEMANGGSMEDMMKMFHSLIPHIFGFLFCFFAIAQSWLAHNAFFSIVSKYSHTLGFFNLLLLLPGCLFPFAAMLIGNYPQNPFSVALFGALYFFSAVVTVFMSRYLWKNKMMNPSIDAKTYQEKVMRGSYFGPFIILAIIGVAFINVVLSFILFSLLIAFWMFLINQMKLVKED